MHPALIGRKPNRAKWSNHQPPDSQARCFFPGVFRPSEPRQRKRRDVMAFLHSNEPAQATIINTGSELLLGKTLNTHGQFLANALWPLGIEVVRQVTLPDGDAIQTELLRALEESDVVILTGGLGPTTDDMTRDMVAAVLEVPMELDVAVEAGIREYIESRGYVYAAHQSRQAMVPHGGEVLPNPYGTAPGLFFGPEVLAEFDCHALAVLPGPPRELYPMVHEQLAGRLTAALGDGHADTTRAVDFRLVGVGESMVTEALEPSLVAIEGLKFGYCARVGEVDVRCVGSDPLIDQARCKVMEFFGGELIGETGESLVEVVLQGLRASGQTLATAESCTGGSLAGALTDVGGASDVFLGGYVTYSNEAKVRDLSVEESALAMHGAVSEEVCAQMVAGCQRRTGAGFALACTGIAGPSGGSVEKPVGTVFIGLGFPDGRVEVEQCHFKGDRLTFKQRVIWSALDRLRRAMKVMV